MRYTNGNTTVTIENDGTKVREWDGMAVPKHPESIDLKITDYCDLGCAYCHESSTVAGRHASIASIEHVIDGLPAGVEIAVGGGDPLSHPELIEVLQAMRNKGLIPNITINQGHVLRNRDLITKLIDDGLVYGVGVSITSRNEEALDFVAERTPNLVIHIIAGVHDSSILKRDAKFLVLGYKQFGRGVEAYSESVGKSIQKWRMMLPLYLGYRHLSFDNLAIEQLRLRKMLPPSAWEKFYMGDDFTFTMYADAVKREYAPTSRSSNRTSFSAMSTLEFFSTRACATPEPTPVNLGPPGTNASSC